MCWVMRCPGFLPAVQSHFTELPACRWQWHRKAPGSTWQPVPGTPQRLYTPVPQDAGCMLRVECTPGRQAGGSNGSGAVFGAPAAADCGPVDVPPDPLGAAPRHALTQQPTTGPELRVLTYNILADQYAATEAARTVIFAHCPPQHLHPDYRRPLVLAEVLGFRPDLACLQEVDERMFTQYLQPQLEEAGGCSGCLGRGGGWEWAGVAAGCSGWWDVGVCGGGRWVPRVWVGAGWGGWHAARGAPTATASLRAPVPAACCAGRCRPRRCRHGAWYSHWGMMIPGCWMLALCRL